MNDFLNYDTAGELFRLKSYESETPERDWEHVAPGAKRTWIMHATEVIDVALDGEPIYRKCEQCHRGNIYTKPASKHPERIFDCPKCERGWICVWRKDET